MPTSGMIRWKRESGFLGCHDELSRVGKVSANGQTFVRQEIRHPRPTASIVSDRYGPLSCVNDLDRSPVTNSHRGAQSRLQRLTVISELPWAARANVFSTGPYRALE